MVHLYKPTPGKSALGQQLKVHIESTDYEANGISRYQQKIMFVQGALAGEDVLVKVTEHKNAFYKASLVKVLKPSADRIAAPCQYFGHCGGCQLQYLDAEQQRQLKQQGIDELIRHQTGLTLLPWQNRLSAADFSYRRKARIGIWYDKKSRQVMAGFRQGADKRIQAVSHCLVLHPALAPVFRVLTRVISQLARPETITQVEIVAADDQPYITVRHTRPLTATEKQLFVDSWPEAVWLGEAEPGQYQPWQQQQTTVEPFYTLADQQLTLYFSPADFIQVNAVVNQKMVNQALEWLAPGPADSILDLYAGVGNFSLALAQRAKNVVGIEGVLKMVHQAETNAKVNGLSNVRFYQADLHLPWGKAEWNQKAYQIVVLDPARAGAAGAVEQVVRLKPEKILYVSCNAATFARDACIILAAGYQLQKISGIDMFPQTSHLELMVLFNRVMKQERIW